MAGALFVAIPRERLLGAIESMGLHATRTQVGRELVVDIHLPEVMNVVRVYTSISVDGSEVRESGVDAVRICTGLFSPMTNQFFPVRGSVTLKRTAPKDGDRVLAWVARFSTALALAIDTAKTRQALPCPKCFNPMVMRTRKYDGKYFLGCVDYPRCTFATDFPEGY